MADTSKVWDEVNQLISEKKRYKSKSTYRGMTTDQFKNAMKAKFNNLSEHFPTIFEKTFDGTMDMDRLKYMLDMLSRVKSNQMSQHDASVKVGETLANEYVTPVVEKLGDEDN